ncbi:MAG TPA: hypothetical protein VG097_13545 [Gemmata sp.]|jgi:hypothetical protein|nr:hypothetical protein [Gemmata sp.]
MKRLMFGFAALTVFAVCSGTASAQVVVSPAYPQQVVPVTSPVVVGSTIVTPGVVVAPPTVVVSPPFPVIRLGYPYYGRSYYYPHYYHRRW